MAVFWPTHHTLRGYWKHFGTSILRNQQATIFRWFFWRTWHQTGHKGQYLAYNGYVGKHGRFGAKSWNDGRWQVLVLPHGENTNAILFWSGMGKVLDFETMLQLSFSACRFDLLSCIRETNVWPKLTKNDGFGAYLAVFGQQLPFFGREQKIWYPHLFCVQNIDQQFPHGLLGP